MASPFGQFRLAGQDRMFLRSVAPFSLFGLAGWLGSPLRLPLRWAPDTAHLAVAHGGSRRRAQQAGHLARRPAGQRGQHPAGLRVQGTEPPGRPQVGEGIAGTAEAYARVTPLDQRGPIARPAFQQPGEPVLRDLVLTPVSGGTAQPVRRPPVDRPQPQGPTELLLRPPRVPGAEQNPPEPDMRPRPEPVGRGDVIGADAGGGGALRCAFRAGAGIANWP
ncbi:hypothetical protein ACIQOU_05380 [Streptomyces sp. NPDC091279]|uniref:hypothetical protein n=1 Tax=Streptomyces sp. NPDC091279 TaxID=3365983 RepID=UPI003827C45C